MRALPAASRTFHLSLIHIFRRGAEAPGAFVLRIRSSDQIPFLFQVRRPPGAGSFINSKYAADAGLSDAGIFPDDVNEIQFRGADAFRF